MLVGVVTAQKNPEGIVGPDGFVRCLTTEYNENLQNKFPSQTMEKAAFEEWLAPKIAAYKQRPNNGRRAIITIPVVIHIIHDGDPINTASGVKTENISYAQAVSQIDVLNQDFRRIMGTPGAGTSGYNLGADVEVEFCLASLDPNGAATNGVNRVNLCESSWSTTDINNIVKPETIWDPTKYMNMWSVNFTRTTLLGYAQFPSASGLPGLPNNGGVANTDGVVSNYNAFGTIAASDGSFILNNTYNLGRTMTHEVGHFLGLRHIWGDGDCSVDDFCADTPNSDDANYTCNQRVSCGSADMTENYMDYTNDACMDTFTQDQKDRILTVLANSPRRMELGASNGCSTGTSYNNEVELRIACIAQSLCGTGVNAQFELINKGTNPLTTATIQYATNNGTPVNYTFNGNVPQYGIATFTITMADVINGINTLDVNVVTVNGAQDELAANNTDSEDFTVAESTVVPYDAVRYELSLLTDRYGNETTFEIIDEDGTIVAQGGPYPNSTQINATFDLDDNKCYQFSIFDTQGDGICCAYGNGGYSITTSNGEVVVQGGDFDDVESTLFRTQTSLSVEDNTLLGFSIYPNPTRAELNIQNANNELPDSYSILNTLGQEVKKAKINSSADLNLNVSNLRTGLYFIQIEKNNQKVVVKFVKK